jgi:hypothetical protein
VIETKRLRWVGHAACMQEMRNAYNILVGKPREKRPLERTRHRWENNIKTDIREVLFKGVDSSGSGWGRVS